jgi:hypothetical protein
MKTFCPGEILLRDIFEFSLAEIKHMCSTERPHISLILLRRLQQATSTRERGTIKYLLKPVLNKKYF